MSKIILIFLSFIFILETECQIVFNKQYYSSIINSENDFGNAYKVIQSSDSNFVFVGTSANLNNMIATKFDSNGGIIWSFVSNLGVVDFLSTILEASDGNYIVGGTNVDSTSATTNAILLKINKNNGNIIWMKKYGLQNASEVIYSLKQTKDLGFIFSGSRGIEDTLGSWQTDVYVVKTDSVGNKEWERTIGGIKDEWSRSIEVSDDGGFMIFGITNSLGAGPWSMYLIKTDSLGQALWQKTYGGPYSDWGLSICKLIDGNFALVGGSEINSTKSVGLLIKINPDGEIIWQKKYFGLFDGQEFSDLKQLPNSDIIVCGSTQGDTIGTGFFGVLNLVNENDGSLLWHKKFNYFKSASTDHYFWGIDLCLDGGFIMSGSVRNWNPGEGPENAMWVVKTDCMGNDSIWDNAACPIKTDTPDTVIDFNLYPNPSTGNVTLDYFIPQNAQNQSITFYDATGKLVQKVDFTGEGQIQLNIDCRGFSNGVYQCVLVSDGEVVEQGKLVIIQ